ncbi:MAG TPA: hypothetical protein IAC03_02780 [Candidatus Coprenecus pullistercoris]|nr:hypothetical protein [Candidatus Coprenecus pullistercoris]
MKKFIVIAVALFTAAAVYAQPRAIGGRLGWGAEVSYQHFVRGADFVELDLGLFNFNSVNVTAIYDFVFAEPQWTSKGTWQWYAGPGASLGLGWYNSTHANISAAGNVGLSYTFWFPLELSFDFRVQLGWQSVSGNPFYWGIGPAIGVRYHF